jgi:hypothetical protein
MREGEGVYRNGNIEVQGNFRNDELVGNSTLKQTNPEGQYLIKGNLTQPELSRLEA